MTETTPTSFTCPRCQMTSHHPEDARHGYCGACHAFTGSTPPDGARPTASAPASSPSKPEDWRAEAAAT